MVCILNQTLFTPEFLKEAFWGLSFFSSSLMMCMVPSIIVRLSPYTDDTVIFTSASDIDAILSNLSQDLD